MSYKVRLRLENPTANKIIVDIHRGMLFEVIDAISHVENMMVDCDYQIQLKPYERKVIEVVCRCANPQFRVPIDTPVQATPFTASASLG